jgi:hypothetical protein
VKLRSHVGRKISPVERPGQRFHTCDAFDGGSVAVGTIETQRGVSIAHNKRHALSNLELVQQLIKVA